MAYPNEGDTIFFTYLKMPSKPLVAVDAQLALVNNPAAALERVMRGLASSGVALIANCSSRSPTYRKKLCCVPRVFAQSQVEFAECVIETVKLSEGAHVLDDQLSNTWISPPASTQIHPIIATAIAVR
jgi:hypothetical protein